MNFPFCILITQELAASEGNGWALDAPVAGVTPATFQRESAAEYCLLCSNSKDRKVFFRKKKRNKTDQNKN